MNRVLKILLLIFILLYQTPSFAKIAPSSKSSDDTNVIDEMHRREQVIYNRLQTSKDPIEKQALRAKLRQLQELYYDKDIRTEFIRKNNPAYAKATEASNTKKKQKSLDNKVADSEQSNSSGNNWDSLSKKDRTSICSQILKECNKNKNLYYCRFTVTKCHDYVPKGDYDNLVNSFKKRK